MARTRRSWWMVAVGVGLVIIGGGVWLYWPRPIRTYPPAPPPEPSPPAVASEPPSVDVLLFFSHPLAPALVPEPRTLEAPDPETLARRIVEALIAGPTSENLRPILPPQTTVHAVLLDPRRRWILVDFDASLTEVHPGGSAGEILTVYGVVTSLLYNLKDYRRVWILIDHRPRKVLKYHVFIGAPLPFNASWLQGVPSETLP